MLKTISLSCIGMTFGSSYFYFKTKKLPNAKGKFPDVGSYRLRFPQSISGQIFYPCLKPSKISSCQNYRKEFIQGVGNFINLHFLLQPVLEFMIGSIPHPCHVESAVIQSNQNLPLMIFQHGLGGNTDVYTNLCKDLASEGMIVISLDHEDGSASYGEDKNTKQLIQYSKPYLPYTRENVINWRKPFLDKRLEAVQEILNFVMNSEKIGDPFVHDILSQVNKDHLFIGGHSFGAASSVLACQNLSQHFKGCLLYDIWPYPLSESTLEIGIQIPTISLLSEQFAKNNEYQYTQKLFMNSPKTCSFFIQGSNHQNFSDTVYWFPHMISKLIKIAGNEDIQQIQDTCIKSSYKFIHQVIENPNVNKEQLCRQIQEKLLQKL